MLEDIDTNDQFDPGDLVNGDPLYLFRYDYEADHVFTTEVVEEWNNHRVDPRDLFCSDGPPHVNNPSADWLAQWGPFFAGPGSYGDLVGMISAPLYYRSTGYSRGGWGETLQHWLDRAKLWRDAVEKHFPRYAMLPKFLYISHRQASSDVWLEDMEDDQQNNLGAGPDWYIEMVRYCVEELGINIVGFGSEPFDDVTGWDDYSRAMDDYVVPAMQRVTAVDWENPKPSADPGTLNTGFYVNPLAIWWLIDGQGLSISDNSGEGHTLTRDTDLMREAGMNGPAVRVDRDDDGASMYVADSLLNTDLLGLSGLSFSIILAGEQPIENADGEIIAGWRHDVDHEPSLTVYAYKDPMVTPTVVRLRFEFSFRDDTDDPPSRVTITLEDNLQNYALHAHYLFTVSTTSGCELYRRLPHGNGAELIDSDSTPVRLAVGGGSTSKFAIGGAPGVPGAPDPAYLSKCEVEHIVILKRVLIASDRDSLFADPYMT